MDYYEPKFELKRKIKKISKHYEYGDIAKKMSSPENIHNAETIDTFDDDYIALYELNQHRCTTWINNTIRYAEEWWVQEVNNDFVELIEIALPKYTENEITNDLIRYATEGVHLNFSNYDWSIEWCYDEIEQCYENFEYFWNYINTGNYSDLIKAKEYAMELAKEIVEILS